MKTSLRLSDCKCSSYRLQAEQEKKEKKTYSAGDNAANIVILTARNISRSQAACRTDIETGGVCTYSFLGYAGLFTVFQFPLLTENSLRKAKALFSLHCYIRVLLLS